METPEIPDRVPQFRGGNHVNDDLDPCKTHCTAKGGERFMVSTVQMGSKSTKFETRVFREGGQGDLVREFTKVCNSADASYLYHGYVCDSIFEWHSKTEAPFIDLAAVPGIWGRERVYLGVEGFDIPQGHRVIACAEDLDTLSYFPPTPEELLQEMTGNKPRLDVPEAE